MDFDLVSRVYDLLPIPTHPRPIGERMQDREGPTVDLGGGTGRFTRTMHPPKARPIVTDPSRGMLAKARARDLRTVQGVGQALPFHEDSLAAVTITEAFHHFTPHHEAVLDQIQRALRHDGVLLVEEIDPTRWLGRLIELGEHLVGFDSIFYPPDELEDMARARFDTVHRDETSRFTYLIEARGPLPLEGQRAYPSSK